MDFRKEASLHDVPHQNSVTLHVSLKISLI